MGFLWITPKSCGESQFESEICLKNTPENYLDLIKPGLPRHLVDYPDLIKSSKEIEGLIYVLTTNSVLISKGVHKQIPFQDFPLRGTAVTFKPIDGKLYLNSQ